MTVLQFASSNMWFTMNMALQYAEISLVGFTLGYNQIWKSLCVDKKEEGLSALNNYLLPPNPGNNWGIIYLSGWI